MILLCAWRGSRGFRPGAVFEAAAAMRRLLFALYNDTTMPEYPKPSNIPLSERNEAIISVYKSGATLEYIAGKYGISIARAHQLINGRNR